MSLSLISFASFFRDIHGCCVAKELPLTKQELLPFVFVGFKVSQLNKKLQPISSRDNPLSRLQFFDLHTETYYYEVKQKIEIIFAQPISHFLLYGFQTLPQPNKNKWWQFYCYAFVLFLTRRYAVSIYFSLQAFTNAFVSESNRCCNLYSTLSSFSVVSLL